MKLSKYKFYRKLLKGIWYQNRYILEKGIEIKWERKEYKQIDSKEIRTIKIERHKKSFLAHNAKKD